LPATPITGLDALLLRLRIRKRFALILPLHSGAID